MRRSESGSQTSAPQPDPMIVEADRGQLLAELLEAAEVALDRVGQLARGSLSPLGTQVLPEERVQDVAREVEGERLLQSPDPREVLLVARLVELLERRVGALDVSPVMLVVVQFHDLSRDVRLERAVVVLQVRKRVFRHVSLLSFRSRAEFARVRPA